MALRLNGQTSGYVELDAPAVAGSNTLVLPTNNGSSGQYLQTDGSGGLSWQTVTDTDTTGWTWDTTGTTMTGSAVNIDGIPSTATRIKFVFKNYSQSSGGNFKIQLRVSGVTQTSTYETVYAIYGGSTSGGTYSDSWNLGMGSTVGTYDGEGEIIYTGNNSWWGKTTHKRTQAAANYVFTTTGVADMSGTVTGISFNQDSGTMGGGTIFVHYFEP